MKNQLWTVARYPNGSWSTGGKPDDPEHPDCWVTQVLATSREKAKSKAQGKYYRQNKGKVNT